ncbi:hypothetical protein C8R41DRAFT_831415 [Lentinula lateritia]|uniref:Uncharacterized protein n=1 Tax=Lentinula lateritia TaxID=40482 RepID=A0ABQ8VJK8_9AGAR|nr:hypothetical protein C8R41DRAFT_831415 [Lentinula lateritia]
MEWFTQALEVTKELPSVNCVVISRPPLMRVQLDASTEVLWFRPVLFLLDGSCSH